MGYMATIGCFDGSMKLYDIYFGLRVVPMGP